MKISLIQSDTIWEDKSRNFQNLLRLLTPLFDNTDLVILPEMFNTGFSMNPVLLGESPDGETLDWMKDISLKGNFGICGSYIVHENSNYYNRWVFVSPVDEIWHYDKHHLFSMGGENRCFTAGNSRLTFSFRGVKINPFICYDLRFPVWSRNRNSSDLLIFAANWPSARNDVWITLLKARAIENQCFVAGTNRTGTDGTGVKYSGDSMIISPRGSILASALNEEECFVTAEISIKDLSEFRKKFPVLNDSDDFTINI